MANEWWKDMSQEELDDLLYQLEYDQNTALPSSFGGGMQPELDYSNYDLLQMGGGVDIPEYTTKGAVDPYDLSQQVKRASLAKSMGGLTVDNALTGMAGPGAYGIDAFTPTYEYGEPLNLTGRRKAEAMAQTGGYEGFLAQQVLDGKSQSEAEAALWKVVNAPESDELSDEDRAMKQSLLDTLPGAQATDQPMTPSMRGTAGQLPGREGRAAYDMAKISQTASDLWNGIMEDPEYSYFDEVTGKYYDKTPEEAMVKTPQMEFFEKYGLPYPTEGYGDEKYLNRQLDADTGMDEYGRAMAQEDFDQRFGGMQQRVGGAVDEFGAANKAYQDLNKAWAGAETRPETEWDRMLTESRGGGSNAVAGASSQPGIGMDQAGAQISNMLRAGGQNVGPTTQPQAAEQLAAMFRAQGGLSGGAGPGFQAPTGGPLGFQQGGPLASGLQPIGGPAQAMTTIGPWITQNRAGNTVPYDFGKGMAEKDRPLSWFPGSGPGAAFGTKNPTVRRGTEKDVEAQRKRRQTASAKVQRESGARQAATYQDPGLAAITAFARAQALGERGRTPYLDAMATRRMGLGAMGV